MKTFDAIWSFLTYIAGIFLIPFYAVNLVRDPESYWNWVGLVVWVYLILANILDVYGTKAVREGIKQTEEGN